MRKHNVIKLCSIEYLTTQIQLVLPTFKSGTVHKIIEYLTAGLYSLAFEISIAVQKLPFLWSILYARNNVIVDQTEIYQTLYEFDAEEIGSAVCADTVHDQAIVLAGGHLKL